MELQYTVTNKENGMKIAKILREKLLISSRLLTKLKMNEKIIVNHMPVYSNYLVTAGDKIVVKIDFQEEDAIQPEEIPLSIVYEDAYFLAVNKPAGMVVHPSANHQTGTLANGVKNYLQNAKKIRPINRLDRDTSGIVLFAKNEYIQERMIQNATMQKEYIAIVEGILEQEKGTIDLPIRRKEGSIMEREVSVEGQRAVTHFEVLSPVLENGNNFPKSYSILRVQLETGRTHQIRVHFAHIGHPILGDTLYGKSNSDIARQALHAYRLFFIHPITGQRIQIVAPLPEDMKQLLSGSEMKRQLACF